MNIDFHHATTYVVARISGFDHNEAEIIAHASQYVDDATETGVIQFENNAMYSYIYSAHKMLDYRNFNPLANQNSWLPFHFVPGNGGKRPGENPKGSFIEKIVCIPDSYVIQDIARACIEEKNKIYGLYRLGVTMHALADTYSHQGFAGVAHEINDISSLDEDHLADAGFIGKLLDFFKGIIDALISRINGRVFPLGHVSALHYPDLPYLVWRYKDKHEIIERDNPEIFMRACHEMCKALRKYKAGDYNASVSGIGEEDSEKIIFLLRNVTDDDHEKRHQKWLTAIEEGHFSFPAVKLADYKAEGQGSWKRQALGTPLSAKGKSDIFEYDPSFPTSHWKLFHDALLAHRFTVINDILPRYGICAA